MEIQETLMSRSFSVMNADPYLLALRAMEEISRDAKVVERKNVYESDGPHHRCMVNFDTVDIVDDFAKVVFNFDMTGESGLLRVGVNGVLDLKIIETGFFSEMFADHYVKTIFPILRKVSEDRVNFFGNAVDRVFANNG
jgi:hypothetical protein